MAELKKLSTRIINKHATAAVWNNTDFTPLQGEIVVYDPGLDPKDGKTYSYERMKIGDGTHTIQELSFVNQEVLDSKANAEDIPTKTSQLENDSGFITSADIPQDTNTTYDLDTSKSSTNGNVKVNLTAGGSGSGTDSVTIKGSGATTVTTDANGVIIINSTDTDNDTTYSAGTGLSLDGTTFNHSNSVTSGTASGSSGSVGYGGTITIPSVTYDAQGHITAKSTTTVTLPPMISPADLGLEQAMKFLGSTTTAIYDGSTTQTITLSSRRDVTAENGNVVLYDGYEYVWTGSMWEQLGQEGSFSLKTHTHTVSHTPEGTVSIPTITVTPNTTTVNSITDVGTLPSLTYEEVETSKISAWSAGTLPSASLSDGAASLTGSVSSGPNRVVTLSHSYTKPELTFTAGSVPTLTWNTVKPHSIKEWAEGTLPTKGSNTTVVTSIKSATSTQPTFTGTAATLTTDAANS